MGAKCCTGICKDEPHSSTKPVEAYPARSYPLIQTSSLTVQGAGGIGESINGVYTIHGLHCHAPKYVHSGGKAIIFKSGHWKINVKDDTSSFIYSVPYAHDALPPACQWTTEGYDGGDADPPPTIKPVHKDQSIHDLQKMFDTRSSDATDSSGHHHRHHHHRHHHKTPTVDSEELVEELKKESEQLEKKVAAKGHHPTVVSKTVQHYDAVPTHARHQVKVGADGGTQHQEVFKAADGHEKARADTHVYHVQLATQKPGHHDHHGSAQNHARGHGDGHGGHGHKGLRRGASHAHDHEFGHGHGRSNTADAEDVQVADFAPSRPDDPAGQKLLAAQY